MYIYTGTVYTRRGPPQVDVQRAQNERSDLSSSSRWKLRKTSSRRKLHAVPCRCTRMSCTAVLTASSLGGPCIGSQACNCCQGRSPPFPASQAASAAAPMYSQRYRSASGATAIRKNAFARLRVVKNRNTSQHLWIVFGFIWIVFGSV